MHDRVWRCRDGREMPVSQMETRHIENCLRMMWRSGYTWREEYRDRLELELEIRNMRDRTC